MQGISLSLSTQNFIIDNFVRDNNNIGILMNYSNDNEILNNQINNHQNGIYLFSSNDSFLAYNKGVGNLITILEHECSGNIFFDNFFLVRRNISHNGSKKSEINKIDFTTVIVVLVACCSLIYLVRKVLFSQNSGGVFNGIYKQ